MSAILFCLLREAFKLIKNSSVVQFVNLALLKPIFWQDFGFHVILNENILCVLFPYDRHALLLK